MINSITGEKITQKRIIKRTMEILFSIDGVEDTVGNLTNDIVKIFGKDTQLKGVNIEEIGESEIRLEIFIKTNIGYPIPKIAQMAQRKIKEEIEDYYKIKVASVDVNVMEVQFE